MSTASDLEGTAPQAQQPSMRSRADAIIQSELGTEVSITYLQELNDGYTDALVARCDFMGAQQGGLDGQFIVKVSADGQSRQHEAHERFSTALGGFAEEHVPGLRLSAGGDGLRVDVYEIAGGSLRNVGAAEMAHSPRLLAACRTVSAELLEAQLSGCTGVSMQAGRTLDAWLGEGFLRSRRGDALRDTRRMADISGSTFVFHGEVLPDPVSVLEQENELTLRSDLVLMGFNHGDLHLRNILLDATRSYRGSYWLIDVNWGQKSPLLYDQAYLETAALISMQSRLRVPVPLAVLQECDGLISAAGLEWQGLVSAVRAVRDGTHESINRLQPGRVDSLTHQYLLARLGAALNYAAKNMPERDRVTAYQLAGWITHNLLKEYHPELRQRVLEQAQSPRAPREAVVAPARPTDVEALAERLAPFLATAHSGYDRILIVEAGVSHPDLAHLLAPQWTVIVDLSPESERSGLARHFDPESAEKQTVMFGLHEAPSSGRNTVSWIMAGGWETRGEAAPATFVDWRRSHLPVVRGVLDRSSGASVNRAAAVLCLSAGSDPDQRSERIMEEVEVLYEQTDVVRVPGDGDEFRALLDAFGSAQAMARPDRLATLPGQDSPVPFEQEQLVRLAADLVVLHSRILVDELREEPVDEFWRGRPASWVDLDAGLDVPRDTQPMVQGAIGRVLRKHSSATFEIFHTPGAGGTTLARRIAWDLHRDHPVVFLHHYGQQTVERIDDIYRATKKSVLVVVESATLGQSEREDLYYKLHERNTPAVVLWVTRGNRPTADPGAPASGKGRKDDNKSYLKEPLSAEEAREFRAIFGARARTPRARAAVERLIPGSAPEQHLSPFYFGLSAFEEDFEGTRRYVDSHVAHFNDLQRSVAGYLSLVTRFTQNGLPYFLVRRWLTGAWGGQAASAAAYQEDLRSTLGEDLRHLSVENDEEVRILHPSVAEKVLESVLESVRGERDWEFLLANTAIEFISQVSGHLGPDNAWTKEILQNLFIRRDKWSGSTSNSQRFAEFIHEFENKDQAYRVLEELTRRCPSEPHFWLHLGRFHASVRGHLDGKAETLIKKAIDLSDELDPVPFHSLAMLHRESVRDELIQFGSNTGREDEAIARIRDRYDEALRVFGRARQLNGIDEHNYVTPVQMIVTVLNQLRRISQHSNLIDLIRAGGMAADWASEQLSIAELLLDECELARPDHQDSSYLSSCKVSLDTLHGGVKSLVSAWRELVVQSRSHSRVALVLARALLREHGDDWQETSPEVFRTAVEFYDAAFDEKGDLSEHDVQLWFRCYRRLPEYDELAALERFSFIASSRPSPVCRYYLYVLRFMRWLNGDELKQDEVENHMAEAKALMQGRRKAFSYEWVAKDESGKGADIAPRLAHFSELGERRPATHDWENSANVCRRVRGVVRKIEGQQAGWLAVEDGSIEAFFVPREEFLRHRDINKVVEFDLGFAQDGLRAWRVEVAKEARLLRRPDVEIRTVEVVPIPLPSQVRPTLPRPGGGNAPVPTAIAVSPEIREQALALADTNEREAYRLVIGHLVSSASGTTAVTSLNLGVLLQKTFGDASYARALSGTKLRPYVEGLGFRVTSTAHGQFAVTSDDAAKGADKGSDL
ncbi:hypothetical protein ABZS88_38385 [Streptomyces sp. NPDC005480]|uniref:hypothetical protein n=1 Tax=Streptomyces sp. NPDC005480 TaxID=3154880 RepID=UPI0033A366DA